MLTIITENNNVSCFNTIDSIHVDNWRLEICSAGGSFRYEFAHLFGKKILGNNTIENIKVNGKSVMPECALNKLSDLDEEYCVYCAEVMYMPATIMEALAAK